MDQPLVIEYRPINDLLPYARNSRTHTPEQVNKIAASMREFGWTNPLLIGDDGRLIAGHARLLAASELGYAEVPCVPLSHLTELQRRAYVIADNQLAILGGWDANLLAFEVDELRDEKFKVSLLGFGPNELNELIGTDKLGPPLEERQQERTALCPRCGHTFKT